MQTGKVYVRDATMVSAYALLLFGGEIQIDRENGFIVIGDWIRYSRLCLNVFYARIVCVKVSC